MKDTQTITIVSLVSKLGRTAWAFGAATLAAGALGLAPSATASPALWEVKSPTATVYLFGTVHLLKPDAKWMSPKVQGAFNRSTTLRLEIANLNDTVAAQAAVGKLGLDLAHPLSTKLTPEEKAKLITVMAGFGVPAAAMEPVKPWLVAVTLSVLPLQKAGWDGKSGVEISLMKMASDRKEPVTGFETIEQQLAYFDGLPQAEQVAYLDESLDEAPNIVGELDKIEADWERGDVDAIAHALNDDMKRKEPKLYDLLLTQRNLRFAQGIETLLKGSGVTFVAVGAAHLAGPDSVQAQLQKSGVRVERLRD